MSSLGFACAVWRKSSHSGGNNDQCVELALHCQAVRDSKNPTGGTLVFDRRTAERFVSAVKDGRFDG